MVILTNFGLPHLHVLSSITPPLKTAVQALLNLNYQGNLKRVILDSAEVQYL